MSPSDADDAFAPPGGTTGSGATENGATGSATTGSATTGSRAARGGAVSEATADAGALQARAFPVEVPFLTDLGMQVLEFGQGRAVLALDVQRRHTNSLGATHGGVAMTMLDVAMAMAARSFGERGPGTNVTIEMSTSFMRPSSGRVTAHGQCLHRTATMAFCEAELRDARGELCAKAKGTFKYWRRAVSAD